MGVDVYVNDPCNADAIYKNTRLILGYIIAEDSIEVFA
jgi:hypothetical protein